MNREDYTDPICPFCVDQYRDKPPVRRIEVRRVLDRFDSLCASGEIEQAESLLLRWKDEAKMGRDERGQFAMCNELMGLYRKCGQKEKAYAAAGEALGLAESLNLQDSVTGATALVNAATVYKAFGDAAAAMPLFEKARVQYEALLDPADSRLGGLFNNMGLALSDLRRYDEAKALFEAALGVMEKVENGELEQAVTLQNIASALEEEKGIENTEDEIGALMSRAMVLLDTPSLPRNAYYAFVADKCAPAFGRYGFFLYEEELRRRIAEIKNKG